MTPEIKEILKENKKTIIVLTVLLVVIIAALSVWIFKPELIEKARVEIQGGKVIEEKIVIPETTRVTVEEARIPSGDGYAVPLVPKTNEEHIIVGKAVLTIKGSYDIAAKEGIKWSPDARLVYIKSLGAVTIEGKSSTWQIAMGSKTKKKGYEVIVQEDKIISQKEIESNSYGFDLPNEWYDSNDAVVSLQTLPQFSDATISSLSFYYNTDGKRWGYAFATSRGTTSMPVR